MSSLDAFFGTFNGSPQTQIPLEKGLGTKASFGINPGSEVVRYTAARDGFIKTFEDRKSQLKLVKFVPASGAATRMFKALHQSWM